MPSVDMPWVERMRKDDGMVTLELACVLPVLMLITAVLLSAVTVAGDRVRVQDAAREAARLAARGDLGHARAAAAALAPGADIAITTTGADVHVSVGRRVHLLAHWLPAVRVAGMAVSAVEPGRPP